MSKTTIRIIAIQILFFGLLFLPDLSSASMGLPHSDPSLVLRALRLFLDNPAFYAILTISALVFSFSFDLNISRMSREDGTVSLGDILIRSLARILLLYGCIFVVSWLFLTYKTMFMGDVYTNHHIVTYFQIM